jgi:hypothetical protein
MTQFAIDSHPSSGRHFHFISLAKKCVLPIKLILFISPSHTMMMRFYCWCTFYLNGVDAMWPSLKFLLTRGHTDLPCSLAKAVFWQQNHALTAPHLTNSLTSATSPSA